jgi:hypothetical protein
MYLIPLVRATRAITMSILFPECPLEAIGASEIISYISPFINYPPIDLNIIGFTLYLIYDPIYARELMQIYKNKNILSYKIELLLLILFLLNLIKNY